MALELSEGWPMTPHLRTAHLWLFSAGLDPEGQDTRGDSLAVSLAKLLAKVHAEGRAEAAAVYLGRDEDTGEYQVGELRALLSET